MAGALVGAVVMAACGGGGDSERAPGAESIDFLGRDLGGPTVAAASDIESNPLPDLVIDNVSTGQKANLRNILPAEKPVLLWMWAPH